VGAIVATTVGIAVGATIVAAAPPLRGSVCAAPVCVGGRAGASGRDAWASRFADDVRLIPPAIRKITPPIAAWRIGCRII